MFRNLGLIMLLLCPVWILAQSQTNPFDLKYRKPIPRITSTQVIVPQVDTIGVVPSAPNPISVVDNQVDTTFIVKGSRDSSFNPFDINDDSTAITSTMVVEDSVVKKPVVAKGTAHVRSSRGLQIFFLLLSLLFLIFIVNVERSFVRDLWRVISNENYSSLHHRNQRNTMRQILLLMGYLVFIVQAGIFLYHLLMVFGYQGNLLDNIWSCMLLITIVYITRHIMISYLKWLFNNDKEMTLFGFDVSIFNIMVGLVLLPINVMLNFGPESLAKPLIYIGLTVAIIAYLMRQLRWLLTARHLIANSLFLFFVYLCAVEILPLWAISKFFW
ncbi:MAG: DUF4271 domain-containing protein [Bacteroidota bacterium]|nr:DUF4271 domain-containing protein [Bacteroidota bacterium]